MITNVRELKLVEFNEAQLQFFRDAISLYQQDRLRLPLNLPHEEYKLQAVSLESMERAMTWCIECSEAAKDAQLAEKRNKGSTNPHDYLESSADFDEESADLLQDADALIAEL